MEHEIGAVMASLVEMKKIKSLNVRIHELNRNRLKARTDALS